ncbi:MAG: Asp-tRNA(Asn)/Glu-tRNA(Gln) amidotransferase subunit GatB [Firmicutes bacterium]|nr:Asp-tRNA(Asn)/Glu-tRNA(Gln) amidotransferase subunit GatB [Bacillota bacterium]
MSTFEAVIGLEVHVELLTATKLFCGCSTAFGATPNTQVCPFCLGLPGGGTPVLNKRAVEYALKTALALNCQISPEITFDRKNYFYADLPKGYQTTQHFQPLGKKGYLTINIKEETKRIGIHQVHIEEDAGKMVHMGDILSTPFSRVDFNRASVPLVEIVSEPDMHTPEEARLFLQKLRNTLLYIGVSDCKMEEGSLRCDANISLRPLGSKGLGVKTELKNMNSFRAVYRGIEHEIERQTRILQEGGEVTPQTRHWDEETGVTKAMRDKLVAESYRYFPDPTLPPLKISEEWQMEIRSSIPELPDSRYTRFIQDYNLPSYDADVLTASRELGDYYERALDTYREPKNLSNWIMSELLGLLNTHNMDIVDCKVKPHDLGNLLKLIDEGTISGRIAKTVFEEMFATGKKPEAIIKKKGLTQISDEGTLLKIVEEILADNPGSVEDYHSGKDRALGFLVGQVMKKTKGQANPQMVNELLREKLKK